MPDGFFSGLLVVDLTRVLAGPFYTMMLAELGARVVKVEDPRGGDDARRFEPFFQGQSAYFASLDGRQPHQEYGVPGCADAPAGARAECRRRPHPSRASRRMSSVAMRGVDGTCDRARSTRRPNGRDRVGGRQHGRYDHLMVR